MNEEYKEKLISQFECLRTTSKEVERIIDLLKDSNVLDFETKAKTTAFLEGYMVGLKEQIEWLNYDFGVENENN